MQGEEGHELTNLEQHEATAETALICQTLVAKKAHAVTVLDVSALTSVADHFVVASSGSRLGVQALCDAVHEALREHGLPVLRSEGYAEGRWVCLDCGDVLVHVFQDAVREYFDLERLWGDAPRHDWTEEMPALLSGA